MIDKRRCPQSNTLADLDTNLFRKPQSRRRCAEPLQLNATTKINYADNSADILEESNGSFFAILSACFAHQTVWTRPNSYILKSACSNHRCSDRRVWG